MFAGVLVSIFHDTYPLQQRSNRSSVSSTTSHSARGTCASCTCGRPRRRTRTRPSWRSRTSTDAATSTPPAWSRPLPGCQRRCACEAGDSGRAAPVRRVARQRGDSAALQQHQFRQQQQQHYRQSSSIAGRGNNQKHRAAAAAPAVRRHELEQHREECHSLDLNAAVPPRGGSESSGQMREIEL